jgi:phage replication-related protein YjqB (UPF0714/DUF867 family)
MKTRSKNVFVNFKNTNITRLILTISSGIMLMLINFTAFPSYARTDIFGCFDSKGCTNALSTSADCKQPLDYDITRPNSPSLTTDVTVLSFHGGEIELRTSDISKKLAKMYGWDRYDLDGHVSSNRCSSLGESSFEILHITSTNFDDPDAVRLVKAHPKSVAIHGYSRNYPEGTICVGGASQPQINAFIKYVNQNKSVFESSPQGYRIIPINAPSIEEPPENIPENQKPACYDLKGKDKTNIVNRNSSKKGLQLELSRPMRIDLASNSANFNSLRDVIYKGIKSAMSTVP